MHFLVIQHLDIEPPGTIGEVIRSNGHQLSVIHASKGEPLPSLESYDGIIVMGGPQSANDMHHGYIVDELRLLQQAIAMDFPVIGICLGAQLLAKAAGSEIAPSPVRELGWYPVEGTAAAGNDPLFSSLGREALTVFQWHGETFAPVPGAKLLATHPQVMQQAFRLGSCQYGLQFHIEVNEATIEAWIEAGESERVHLGSAGVAAIRREMTRHLSPMQVWCRQLAEAWLHLAGEKREKH